MGLRVSGFQGFFPKPKDPEAAADIKKNGLWATNPIIDDQWKRTMFNDILRTTLNSMRKVAAKVHRCPACHSPHVYTAAHVTYVYDHLNARVEAMVSDNFAENGWHGCFACDHQWVSSPLIQTAIPVEPPPGRPDNVIDLQAFRQNT